MEILYARMREDELTARIRYHADRLREAERLAAYHRAAGRRPVPTSTRFGNPRRHRRDWPRPETFNGQLAARDDNSPFPSVTSGPGK